MPLHSRLEKWQSHPVTLECWIPVFCFEKLLSPLLFVRILLHIWSMLWWCRINKVTTHLFHMLLFEHLKLSNSASVSQIQRLINKMPRYVICNTGVLGFPKNKEERNLLIITALKICKQYLILNLIVKVLVQEFLRKIQFPKKPLIFNRYSLCSICSGMEQKQSKERMNKQVQWFTHFDSPVKTVSCL